MKVSLLFFILFLFGCQHSHHNKDVLQIPPPPKFCDITIPPPPKFVPRLHEVQINSVPMPFHLAHCYIVWVDGKRIMLNSKETLELAKSLNLPTDPPKGTRDLHDGKGWHKPLEIVNY